MLHPFKGYSTLHKTLVCVLLDGFHTIPSTPIRIPLYAGFHDLNNAVSVFETIVRPSKLQWNAIIKAHVDAGFFESALCLFSTMRDAYVHPDHYTLPLINRAISSLPGHIKLGKVIHCIGIQMGLDSDIYFCNTAIDMYARCTCVISARRVFDEMCERDVVSWTSMISGYVRIGNICESLELFHQMRITGLEPSTVTLAVILQVCDDEEDAIIGRQVHGFAIKRGLERNELVENSILTLYSTVGCFEEAEKLFSITEKRSIVSWNIMMSMYLSIGDFSKVVDYFESMMAEWPPSHETLTLVISASARSKDLRQGQKVHSHAVKSGQLDAVMHSSLVDFYAKCGDPASSIQLFEQVETMNSISCSVMMRGLIHNGQYKEAIGLFRLMQATYIEPIAETLRVLILAYTHLGALQLGKGVHAYLIRNKSIGYLDNTTLQTSILHMYAKCGSINLARKVFDRMLVKDTIAWSSIIEAYGVHGFGLKALQHFYRMQEEGTKPNSVTFLSVLSACSHSGLMDEGCEVFDSMTKRFGIKPELNHYTCIVDLLGRSGRLREALELIQGMSMEPDGRIWGALLASCRIYSDVRLGAVAAQRLFDMEPNNVGYHVVLSNIHAGDSKWGETESIRKFMGEKDFRKMPGWSCIEVKGGAYRFVASDRTHPRVQEIYEVLRCLTKKIEETRC